MNKSYHSYFRSGSGTYSCVALSEGTGEEARMTAGNATLLITESVTYLDKVSCFKQDHALPIKDQESCEELFEESSDSESVADYDSEQTDSD